MEMIDQHIALTAQEMALVPDSSLIDGRTETDRLAFLTDFASLINFYDHDNNIHGNWAPFLLKDPAILLAHISKTAINQINLFYRNSCNQIEPLVVTSKISRDLVIGMDHLFSLLTKLFVKIERWIYYMETTAVDYELKKYLIHQVKNIYSKKFWALLALQDKLSLFPYRYKIKPVYYYLYDNFDQYIWKQSKDKSPYWEILGLPHQINKDVSASEVYQAIKKAGDQLLNFLEAVISFAAQEYEKVKAIKGKYPDTLLLRSFVSLLNNYNEQLNGLAAQHLQFYYQDILKQTLQGSVGDEALIFADLAKTDSTFILPAGTQFNGGLDEQKNPILFETLVNANLNPAVIKNAYTINKLPNSQNLTAVQKKANPSVILKDEDGKVQSWPLFGQQDTASVNAGLSGFIISSPLLYLREGSRTITITFETSGLTVNLQTVKFYLSTATGWFLVNALAIAVTSNTLVINLLYADPEIIPFLVNPEKLDNTWPMLKMEFGEAESLIQMTNAITNINLSVNVNGVKNLQFYNDFGTITPKNPYQPFGPVPLLNSSFIIGSNEIFSKPISSFSIDINWNNLPNNFTDYYDVYNKYLTGQLVHLPLLKRIKNFVARVKVTGDLFWIPFNNSSFTSEFMLLQKGNWQSLNMSVSSNIAAVTTALPAGMIDTYKIPQLPLFREDKDNHLQAASNFYLSDTKSATTITPTPAAGTVTTSTATQTTIPVVFVDPKLADPGIQTNPQFKYSAASTSGFMKMVLSGNKFGFGSDLYPKVVAQVATYNAWMIYNHMNMKDFSPAANLPFSPKIAELTASYCAAVCLNENATYPYQCYTYSPLASKPFVFAQAQTSTTPVEPVVTPTASISASSTNDLLFSASNGAFLFLEIENLIPTESLSIYFELAINQSISASAPKKVTYYYLNDNGWNLLNVLADGTANFNCPGIVSMAIPTDITAQTFIGKDKSFWICMAAESNSASFPSVVLLKTNGLLAQRYTGIFTNNLPAGSISKTQNPIPQIAAITQPFPTVGGLPPENTVQMKQRISLRLKTKDRAVSCEDYYRLIVKEYPSIFYTKTLFERSTKTNQIFVVPAYTDWRVANAFTPLVNQELLNDITAFLTERASGLIKLSVSNFNLAPICVNANIQVQVGFTCEGVMKNVNQALNLYLSPWIAGEQPKVTIGNEIENVNLATFIQNQPGVAKVSNVYYNYLHNEIGTKGKLIVSGMSHKLNCSY